MIEARGISKRYGKSIVVDNVEVQIPLGGITALIGPNGAGKSTLLSMMSRLLKPSDGQALIDGTDVMQANGRDLARRMAILRQDNHLPLRLTVRELVAFGRHPHTGGRPTVQDQEHIERAISYLNLTALADRHLDEMSGGERQRAFVAMVLCQDTHYVLLDEPLNSLDMKQAVGMMQVLRRAADELKKTMLLVLHDINFASCYADHIIAMQQGRVVFQGPPSELMQPETLASIYEISMDVHQLGRDRICVYYRGE
ncbi:iron ABC transporter ATP-binding protein [Pseudomonas matsuisoli]|uniref:Iron ABC transporter ATP-binding protein n=1 Tax=Pseudomonas matsuisoli TaxID=1515666 RepID=A0A917PPQ2_9PSED|nr:ATP-binding cassette domain-containing protein [Pseudomonas matsuisoli]GGJ86504.1 iron ABC transporter ATP-binding protein [Pseudomonas matsuisoli]